MFPLKKYLSNIPFALFLLTFGCFLTVLVQRGFQIAGGWYSPAISCDKTVYDFGMVSSNDAPPEHSFVLKNLGKQELKLESVVPACSGCLKITHYTKSSIPPGEHGVVSVQLLPEKLNGSFERGVIVRSNDSKQPVYLLRLKAYITKKNSKMKNE